MDYKKLSEALKAFITTDRDYNLAMFKIGLFEPELSAALDEMTKIVGEIKSLNDASMEIASSNLQMYETIMNGSKAGKTQATYDTRGHKETNSTNSTFEEKI